MIKMGDNAILVALVEGCLDMQSCRPHVLVSHAFVYTFSKLSDGLLHQKCLQITLTQSQLEQLNELKRDFIKSYSSATPVSLFG